MFRVYIAKAIFLIRNKPPFQSVKILFKNKIAVDLKKIITAF